MRNITEANFQSDVLDAESAVVLFVGPWADCSESLEAISTYEGREAAEVLVVDLGDNLAAPIAVATMVTALPCVISYVGGEEVARVESGVEEWLSS